MNDQNLPLDEIGALLWRRRALIGAIVGVGLLAVILLTWVQPPTYRAMATLMVTSARATMAVSPDAEERPRVDPVTDADLASEVALLSSKSLLKEALAPHLDEVPHQPRTLKRRVLDAVRWPLRLPARLYRALHGLPAPSPLDEWADETMADLHVADVPQSTLIEVAFDHRNPAWAATVVNDLVSRHVDRHVRVNRERSAQQFFEEQRALLAGRLRDGEEALRAFQEREQIDVLVGDEPALRTHLAELEKTLAETETELAESRAQAGYLDEALRALPDRAVASAGLHATGAELVESRLVELRLKRSQLRAQYAPTSMKIGEIDRQIAEATRLLAEQRQRGARPADPVRQALETDLMQARARAAALEARAAALRTQRDSGLAHFERLARIGTEQERLLQQVENARHSLATYVQKAEEARFTEAMDESRIVNVVVVDRAAVPESPRPTNPWLTIGLGTLLSLAAAMAIAFARDRWDGRVQTSEEARRIAELPVLGEIPC